MTINLPWPPSVNTYYRAFRGRQILSAKAREYRQAVASAIGAVTPFAESARLAVSVDLCPPDKRRRDVDNYAKSLLDALTHAGIWADDSQIDLLTLRRMGLGKIGGSASVTINEIPL